MRHKSNCWLVWYPPGGCVYDCQIERYLEVGGASAGQGRHKFFVGTGTNLVRAYSEDTAKGEMGDAGENHESKQTDKYDVSAAAAADPARARLNCLIEEIIADHGLEGIPKQRVGDVTRKVGVLLARTAYEVSLSSRVVEFSRACIPCYSFLG